MATVCCVTGSVGDSESEVFVKFDAAPTKFMFALAGKRLVAFTEKTK